MNLPSASRLNGLPRRGVAHRAVTLLVLVPAAWSCDSGVPEAAANGPVPSEAVADRTPEAAPRFPLETRDPSALDAGQVSQELALSRQNAIVRAAERVAPGVVTISVIRTQQVRTSFFDMFGGTRLRRSGGYGSGFVIDASEGVILTNQHVIRGAERIQVTLPDGTDLEPELVGEDEVTDVAVLRVDPGAADLVEVPLGSSRDLLIGEWALALGNPFGTLISNPEPTVTAGVVSAVNRHIIPSDQDESFYLGMIQTDAAINPGNSGGPLVNVQGQVIGVNSSIFSRSGGSEGLGFAIPIDRALRVAEDILATGEIRRAWLGLSVDAEEADEWGRSRGVTIVEVTGGSPAQAAGLRPGRRIVSANGRRLSAPLDWEDILLDLREGDRLVLDVEEAGTVELVAAPFPSRLALRIQVLQDLDVITVTPQIRNERDLAIDFGALVVGITPELQSRTGLREGDVIFGIGNRQVDSAEELAEVFQEIEEAGRRLRFGLSFLRDGRRQYITLTYGG
ncbi:MAG: trypsin-like peptidase domain-containing protein [Gemmatimonadales bacterium]|nr:MAG: trypsin-like peptidase domain-containing protein [Gemmatimonadales bacterium]